MVGVMKTDSSQCAFFAHEIDGRTVELELENMGTTYGKIRARQLAHDSIDVSLAPAGPAGGRVPQAASLDPRLIQRHPKPERAEFLWAQHPYEELFRE